MCFFQIMFTTPAAAAAAAADETNGRETRKYAFIRAYVRLDALGETGIYN